MLGKLGKPQVGSEQHTLFCLLQDPTRQIDACPKCLKPVHASLACDKCGTQAVTFLPEQQAA